jgi:hypothetical protein
MDQEARPHASAFVDRDIDAGSAEVAAASLASDAKDHLAEAAAPLRENARKMAEEQKEAGADRLAEFGHAVHGAASGLERELPQAARLVHSAADNIQSASSRLRERSIDDLVQMYDAFARRQPAAAFAGAVLAGFALSRFLKSSSAEQHEHGSREHR